MVQHLMMFVLVTVVFMFVHSASGLQNPQYDIKDGTGTLHSGITQTAAYYPYEHSLGQYQYDR